jgi:DNA-binding LacI/PurR family transcriptional regulator
LAAGIFFIPICARAHERIRNAGDRFQVFRAAMAKHHLALPPKWVLDGDFTPESGMSAVEKLLTAGKLPTALICANDLMALGALSKIKNARIRVPADLALAGFDGIGITAFTDPPLTTVSQPLFDMGFSASEILFKKIKDLRQPQETVIFPVELIERNST